MKEEQINKEIEIISKLKALKSIVKELKEIFSDKPEYKVYIEDLENLENYIKELESTSTFNLEKGTVNEISINQMNSIIQRYEQYYKLYNNIMIINQELPSVNEDNINTLVEKCVQVHKILVSSELDNHKEIELVLSDFYAIVYKVMKLEVIFSFNQNLFNFIKNDESKISHPYISELIEKDVMSIKDNHELLLKLEDIKSNGIDNSKIIDYDLFKLITIKTLQNIQYSKKDEFLSNVTQMETLKDDIYEKNNILEEKNKKTKELRKDVNFALLKTLGRFLTYAINGAIIVGIARGVHLLEKAVRQKTYYTTMEYNVDTGEDKPSSGYKGFSSDNTVQVIEEEPWIKHKSDYTQRIYTYNLKEKGYTDIKDYLKDIEDVTPNVREINQTAKPESFDPTKTPTADNSFYIIITKFDKDKKEPFELKDHLLLPIIGGILSLIISILIRMKIADELDLESLKYLISRYNDKKEDFSKYKEDSIRTNNEMIEMNKELQEIIKALTDEYNKLSPYIKQLPEVEAAKRKYLSKYK